MSKFTYVGPHDAVDIGGVTVLSGGVFEASPEQTRSLSEQPDNWKPVAAPTKKKES